MYARNTYPRTYTHPAFPNLAPIDERRTGSRNRAPEHVVDASCARACACGTWDPTLCPPVRCLMRATRWCCMSAHERAIVEQAGALFDIVNREHRDCCSALCLIEALGESERMLLTRVLDDTSGGARGYGLTAMNAAARTDRTARVITRAWADNLREYVGAGTDGGDAITRDEFEDALLRAVRACTVATLQTVGESVLAEYNQTEGRSRASDFATRRDEAAF